MNNHRIYTKGYQDGLRKEWDASYFGGLSRQGQYEYDNGFAQGKVDRHRGIKPVAISPLA